MAKTNIETLLAKRAGIIERLATEQDTLTVSEAAKLQSEAKAIGEEITARYSEGADPCECGMPPMGMLKTPGYTNKAGAEVSPVYEVGCVYCPPYLVSDADAGREMRESISSRASSPEKAVENWNARKFVRDDFTDRYPRPGHKNSPGRKIAQFLIDEASGAVTFTGTEPAETAE